VGEAILIALLLITTTMFFVADVQYRRWKRAALEATEQAKNEYERAEALAKIVREQGQVPDEFAIRTHLNLIEKATRDLRKHYPKSADKAAGTAYPPEECPPPGCMGD
jgi:hypothetical protein